MSFNLYQECVGLAREDGLDWQAMPISKEKEKEKKFYSSGYIHAAQETPCRTGDDRLLPYYSPSVNLNTTYHLISTQTTAKRKTSHIFVSRKITIVPRNYGITVP
jgi:hypothetical protein